MGGADPEGGGRAGWGRGAGRGARSAGALAPGTLEAAGHGGVVLVRGQLRHQLEHGVPPRRLLQPVHRRHGRHRGVVQRRQEGVDEEVRGVGRHRARPRPRPRLVLGDDAVVHLLEVLLHLVRARELLLTNRAREHLPVGALVIEEGVPLEAVLVLKALDDLHLLALDAAVRAVAGDVRVLEQVEAAHAHVLQRLRVRARLRGEVAARAGVGVGAWAGLAGRVEGGRPLLGPVPRGRHGGQGGQGGVPRARAGAGP